MIIKDVLFWAFIAGLTLIGYALLSGQVVI